jgi:hypothetical protein
MARIAQGIPVPQGAVPWVNLLVIADIAASQSSPKSFALARPNLVESDVSVACSLSHWYVSFVPKFPLTILLRRLVHWRQPYDVHPQLVQVGNLVGDALQRSAAAIGVVFE